jgi:hypothetical protein
MSPLALTASPVGNGPGLWLAPLVIALALATLITLTIRASFRPIRIDKRHDQSPHRGSVEGGLYHYSPGMYSHSYPPGSVKYLDE